MNDSYIFDVKDKIERHFSSYYSQCDVKCNEDQNMNNLFEITAEPKFVVFIIDDLMDKPVSNLKNVPFEIKPKEFKSQYELIATINIPYEGHFNCFLFNHIYLEKDEKYELKDWWFHDGLLNNGFLIKIIEQIEDRMKENHPYVLFYKQNTKK